jgi:hypothetical protein
MVTYGGPLGSDTVQFCKYVPDLRKNTLFPYIKQNEVKSAEFQHVKAYPLNNHKSYKSKL